MAALYHRARVLTCVATADDPLGLVDDGAVLTDAGRVAWVGAAADAEAACRALMIRPDERVDLGGRLLTPGLQSPCASRDSRYRRSRKVMADASRNETNA